MLSKPNLHPKEIIELLSKLKGKTPEYPSDLMVARKAAFMKQAVAIKLDGKGQGGKGGQGGASSVSGGTGFGGLSGLEGILLQAVIGVWIIAAMLTVAYVFRDQIIDLLQQNDSAVVEPARLPETPRVSTPPAINVIATEPPITEFAPNSENSDLGNQDSTDNLGGVSDVENTPDNSKDNPGLHLGNTPGPPNPPSSDDPDKPDKPKKK